MVMLTLPDVPEVVVVEVGEQAALERAPAVLELVLAGYVLEHRCLSLADRDLWGADDQHRALQPARRRLSDRHVLRDC